MLRLYAVAPRPGLACAERRDREVLRGDASALKEQEEEEEEEEGLLLEEGGA